MKNAQLIVPGDSVIYTFDLFTPRACKELVKQIRALEQPVGGPNSMNKYGKILYGRSLDVRMAQLVENYIAPVAKVIFPDIGPLRKNPYAFSIEYDAAKGKQKSLAKHYDTSAVTMNVCLDGKFLGGEVVFYNNANEKEEVEHVVGRAIIHRGQQLHRAKPILSGTRTNLILWCAAKQR